LEAARVPAIYRNADPGDCFIIATARVRNLTVVTRDARMRSLPDLNPGYLAVIAC
jgi:PIN domain nuclease of toxin-antitoxin system